MFLRVTYKRRKQTHNTTAQLKSKIFEILDFISENSMLNNIYIFNMGIAAIFLL